MSYPSAPSKLEARPNWKPDVLFKEISSLKYYKEDQKLAMFSMIYSNLYLTDTVPWSVCMYVCAQLLQSCPTLCNPIHCSPPGSSVHGILQTRILEWVAMPSSRGSSQLRDRTHVSYWVCALHPLSCNRWAHVPQLLRPVPPRASKSQLLSPYATTTEACVPRACAPQVKPSQWEPMHHN